DAPLRLEAPRAVERLRRLPGKGRDEAEVILAEVERVMRGGDEERERTTAEHERDEEERSVPGIRGIVGAIVVDVFRRVEMVWRKAADRLPLRCPRVRSRVEPALGVVFVEAVPPEDLRRS